MVYEFADQTEHHELRNKDIGNQSLFMYSIAKRKHIQRETAL